MWSPLQRLAGGIALLFSSIFIARSAFVIEGEVYFTLFDDAMISMRYARNLAEGHGLVWNPGEAPVEGYTNLLWTLWMAVLHLLPIPESKVGLGVMISGAVILIANLVVVRRIALAVSNGSSTVAFLAILFTGIYYPLVYWTLRGMEVGMLTLVVNAAILQALRLESEFRPQRLLLLAALLATAILIRPDGIVPYLAISTFVLLLVSRAHVRESATVLLLGLVGVALVLTLFRMRYYGVPVPNTYYLKVAGVTLAERLSRGGHAFGSITMLHLSVAILLASVAGRRLVTPRLGILAAVFVAQCAYSIYVGGDAWEWMGYANRYIAVGMPALLVLASVGVVELRNRIPEWVERAVEPWVRGSVLLVGGLACLAGLMGLMGTSGDPAFFQRYSAWRLTSAIAALASGVGLLLVGLDREESALRLRGVITAGLGSV